MTDPIDMVLHCPACGMQHIDKDEGAGMLAEDVASYGEPWRNPPHRSHLCHNATCRHVWRPADVPTNGVAAVKTRGLNDSPIVQPRRAARFDSVTVDKIMNLIDAHSDLRLNVKVHAQVRTLIMEALVTQRGAA